MKRDPLVFALAGALVVGLLPSRADAVSRCAVMKHAKAWIDAGIMYSQGPGAGYCPGSLYCDPDAGGACYRPDCSGFVSAVWGLPAPGHTTYSLAGGPWDDGQSQVISSSDLKPGDALNYPGNPSAGTGHVMLFGGWLDSNGSLWAYQENQCGTAANYTERNWGEMSGSGYLPIRYNDIQDCLPPVAQVTGNASMTLVNWPDQHVEMFVKTTAGNLQHVWTQGATDRWNGPETLDGGVQCGFAAAFWPILDYAEVFAPKTGGGTGHLWWATTWNKFQDMGGSDLTEMSTLAFPDGHVEVYALGKDHAIWHNFWNDSVHDWSGWQSLGGNVATGVGAVLWGDGHAELFATDKAGVAWHSWSGNYPGGWAPWDSLGGSLSSRPVPVRWPDGKVEAFARGTDGHLYHTSVDGASWAPFAVLSKSTTIHGEPSVISNPAGPEVFARDASDKVVHLWWTGTAWNDFTPLGDQIAASDPFAWIRGDGVAEVFAIDPQGVLTRSYHDATAGWTAWTAMTAKGLDACVPVATGDTSSSGSGASAGAGGPGSGSGAGASNDSTSDDSAMSGSCAWRSGSDGTGSGASLEWIALAAASLTLRRRRTSLTGAR